MILTDNETKVDLLNNQEIAKTVIEFCAKSPALSIGLSVARRGNASAHDPLDARILKEMAGDSRRAASALFLPTAS
jgi:hypothetical protein